MGSPGGVRGGAGLLSEQIKVEQIRNPILVAPATVLSSAVDVKGYGAVLFMVNIGAVTATGELTVVVHEADSAGGAYTPVVLASGAFGAIGAAKKVVGDANTGFTILVDTRKTKEFLKLSCLVGVDNVTFSAIAIKGGADFLPAA